MPQARVNENEFSGEVQGDILLYWREASGGPFTSPFPMNRYQPVRPSDRLQFDFSFESSDEFVIARRPGIENTPVMKPRLIESFPRLHFVATKVKWYKRVVQESKPLALQNHLYYVQRKGPRSSSSMDLKHKANRKMEGLQRKSRIEADVYLQHYFQRRMSII